MVVPNVSRFFREGDKMILSARITNFADEDANGKARLSLFDAAATEKAIVH